MEKSSWRSSLVFSTISFTAILSAYSQDSEHRRTRVLIPTLHTHHKFECQSEGFFPDPEDCAIFYRCFQLGDSSDENFLHPFAAFKFQCRTGAVFDPESISCISSKISTRKECNHEYAYPLLLHYYPRAENQNDVDYGVIHEQGQSTSISSGQSQSYTRPIKNPGNKVTESTSLIPNNDLEKTCKSDGFYPDKKDCTKFYRCVGGESGYMKYEFSCGEGTIWDPDISACNHPWATSRTDCKSSGDENYINSTSSQKPDTFTNYTALSTEKSTFGTSSGTCTTEGFFAVPNDCRKFIRCVNFGNKLIMFDFECSEDTVWDSDIQTCNYPQNTQRSDCQSLGLKDNSTAYGASTNGNSMYEITTNALSNGNNNAYEMSTLQSIATQSSSIYGSNFSTKETPSGSGQHQGIPSLTTQNYNSKPTEIPQKPQSNVPKPQKPPSTVSPYQTENPGAFFNKQPQQNSYGINSAANNQKPTNTQPPESSPGTSTNQMPYNSATSANNQKPSNFNNIGNPYGLNSESSTNQISNNDQHSSISSSQQSSNQVESNQTHTSSFSSSTNTFSNTSTASSSHSTTSNINHTSIFNNTSSTTHNSSSRSDQCTEEGFFPSSISCSKFYRCVKNGNTTDFSKFNFNCGPGTVFDPENMVCGHPSMVKNNKCRSEESQTMTDAEKNSEAKPTSSSITSSTTSFPLTSSKVTTQSNPLNHYNNASPTMSTWPTSMQTSSNSYINGPSSMSTSPPSASKPVSSNSYNNRPSTMSIPSSSMPKPSSSNSYNNNPLISSTTMTPHFTNTKPNSNNNTTSQTPQTTHHQINEPGGSCSKITCQKSGYFPNPNNCKKFYRCVDYTGKGEKFTIYNFDCPPGTIFDPSLETCNHENAVYPPRSCNGPSSNSSCEEHSTTTETVTSNPGSVGPNSTAPPQLGGQSPSAENCGNLKDGQFNLVCPTGFRRHPKYCNLFYQCTTSDKNEIIVTTLSCKNSTVYDDQAVQCLPPEKAKKCEGSMMNTRHLRELEHSQDSIIIPVKSSEPICPSDGLFEYQDDCRLYYKCSNNLTKEKHQGFIHQCPKGLMFSKTSSRCEKFESSFCNTEGILRRKHIPLLFATYT